MFYFSFGELMMEIQSAFNSGLQGFQNAKETAGVAAADIAANAAVNTEPTSEVSTEVSTTPSSNEVPDLNQAIVNLKVAEHQARASSEVIQSADDSLGTLLDVTA